MFGGLLYLMLVKPAVHHKHRRAINGGVRLCLALTFRVVWYILLWERAVRPKTGLGSRLRSLHMFVAENMCAPILIQDVLSFPSGQIPDLLLNTLQLLATMHANLSVCAIPRWGHSMLSMSPSLHVVAQACSDWLSGIQGHFGGWLTSAPGLSCPAVLGFWQLLGWLVACLMVFVAELLHRRAFLRSAAAMVFLGPAQAAAALNWPFQGLQLLQTLFIVPVALLYACALLWSASLPFLS
jgi:hypothetical protein